MSFVTQVLKNAQNKELKTVHENVDVLKQKLTELELEVHQLAERKFVQFYPCLTAAQDLSDKVKKNKDDLDRIEGKIDKDIKGQLVMSTGEFKSLKQQLADAKVVSGGLDYLMEIHNLFQAAAEARSAKKYGEAAALYRKLEAFSKKPLCDQDDKILVLAAMKTELVMQKVVLEQNVADIWRQSVKFQVDTDSTAAPNQAGDPAVKEIRVLVSTDIGELQEMVATLHMSNLLKPRIQTFADNFQNFLIPFIVEHPNVVVDMKTCDSVKTLTLSLPDRIEDRGKKAKGKKSLVSSVGDEQLYSCVFENLTKILEHLHSMLFKVEFGCHDTSLDDSTSKEDEETLEKTKGNLLGLLGEQISPWLLDFLQRDILAKAIPTSAKDLDGFQSVISATQSLQENFVSLGLISSDNHALLNGVDNVNLLFANKKCRLILEDARRLQTSDLMTNTVSVTDDKASGEFPTLSAGGDKKGKPIELIADTLLSDNTLRMPPCLISANIQSLMTMAYETLHEASEGSPEFATQMYYTVHKIFEMFYHVVPTHHGRNIDQFPQMAALHHNNCMYISHHLMTLGHQFSPLLPSPVVPTFMDLILCIRQCGIDAFVAQVKKQRTLILEFLDGANGFASMEDEPNQSKAEKAMKQAGLQLHHLQNVWKSVLPISNYRKALGKLILAMVERITDSISVLEDITQDAAQALTSVLEPFEDQCALELGVSPAEVVLHVSNWQRLTSTKCVLNASLLDIGNLWSEGKGPLALAFSATEVKQLIRALFQNTDRRAAILATIK